MPSLPDNFPISLRAWPQKDPNAESLASLISRINYERGGFRNITEESLEEEIKAAEAGESEDESGDSEDDEDDEEDPDRVKELYGARDQVLGQLDQAHFAATFALDFISLLLSKDAPVQSSLTISPDLRSAVGLGTIGVDKIQNSRVTQAQKKEISTIVKGWKLQSLNDNADSILASATKLEKEIEAETRYWQQLVEVDTNGWAICTLPQERYTLGVRVGFVESAPAFSNRSIAALRRQADGSIVLDQGLAETPPKRLRVRVQRNTDTTGQFVPPIAVPSDSPVLPLILRARNSVFTDELWQELNREGRGLLNHGVVCTSSSIAYLLSDRKIVLDLLPGEDNDDVENHLTNQKDDDLAEGLYLSLHLLLSNAHRERYKHRSKPPKPLDNQPKYNQPLSLLRPIIARITHQNTISSLTSFFSPLSSTLIKAGLTTTPFALSSHHSQHPDSAVTPAARTINTLFTYLEANFTFSITPTHTLMIQSRTVTLPNVESQFFVTASEEMAEAAMPPQGLMVLRDMKEYVAWATACALADWVVRREANGKWSGTIDPTRVRGGANGAEVGFNVVVKEKEEMATLAMEIRGSNKEVYSWSSREDQGLTRALEDVMGEIEAVKGDVKVEAEGLWEMEEDVENVE